MFCILPIFNPTARSSSHILIRHKFMHKWPIILYCTLTSIRIHFFFGILLLIYLICKSFPVGLGFAFLDNWYKVLVKTQVEFIFLLMINSSRDQTFISIVRNNEILSSIICVTHGISVVQCFLGIKHSSLSSENNEISSLKILAFCHVCSILSRD